MSSVVKSRVILYSLNAVLVCLALFLAYRILGPSYDRKESESINKLGLLHTELAAERMGLKLMSLREELKENGLRLVDPARGPINLDSTRWLWMRIQDSDWRAPKFLDPLPSPRTDVDTWAFASAKNSFVVSERIPIVKNGVQDFVLLEGGLINTVFQDLQSDGAFGFWIFDLKAYEKNGIGAAKVFEKTSPSGALSKDEIKLLTSDLLMEIFQKQEAVQLETQMPWVLAFKSTPGPSRLGILGYWVGESKPLNLSNVWLALGAVMLVLSAIFSFLIQLSFKHPETGLLVSSQEPKLETPAKANSRGVAIADQNAAKVNSEEKALDKRSFEGLFHWLGFMGSELRAPWRDIKDRTLAALNILQSPSEGSALEVRKILQASSADLERGFSALSRFDAYFGRGEARLETIDVEVFYKRFSQLNPDLSRVSGFFDPEVWRISVIKDDFGALILSYVKYLIRKTTADAQVGLSARFLSADTDDESTVEIFKSSNFRMPYVRIILQAKTRDPVGKNKIKDLFDLRKTYDRDEVELALTLNSLEKMGARLKAKSGFDDGNVFIVDFPAQEERRAEDKVNAKNITLSSQVLPEREAGEKGFTDMPVAHTIESEPITVLSQSNIHVPNENTRGEGGVGTLPLSANENKENSSPSIRLATIERANSFAEDISDERSRVRSRFRIRKPGEK